VKTVHKKERPEFEVTWRKKKFEKQMPNEMGASPTRRARQDGGNHKIKIALRQVTGNGPPAHKRGGGPKK